MENQIVAKVQYYNKDSTEGPLFVELTNSDLNMWRLLKLLRDKYLDNNLDNQEQ